MTKNNHYPPNIFIEHKNFANSWAYAVRQIMDKGIIITREDDYKGPLPLTRDAFVVMILDEAAVNEALSGKVHPQFPSGPHAIEAYKNEYTYEYVEEHNVKPKSEQFTYLYMDRFINYLDPYDHHHKIDQLTELAYNLRSDGINRRHQMITWIPSIDNWSKAPPCLQRIQIRSLMSKDEVVCKGDRRPIEVQVDFRSRDAYGAIPSNDIGIINMINRYICGHDFKIIKFIDISHSCHIYERDWDEAMKVNMIPEMRRDL